MEPASIETQCPYCGEAVEVFADPYGKSSERYDEDCPVCCRPWLVTVSREGQEVAVVLSREDE